MSPDDTIAPGQRIRQRRKQLGFSGQQLAKMVGCHLQTIDKIERGEIKFSRYLAPIYTALGIEPPKPSPPPPPPRVEPAQAARLARLETEVAKMRQRHETDIAEMRHRFDRLACDVAQAARNLLGPA